MTIPTEAEIMRMIELKQMQERKNVFNQHEMQEKMKLELKYKEYLSLTSAEMEKLLLKNRPAPVTTSVKSDEIYTFAADYKKLYSKKPWYKEPEVKNGKMELSFPSNEEVINFMRHESDQKITFVFFDEKTRKVMAYSNGDGNLYHGDGSDFKPGDKFAASNVDIDDFNREQKSMQSRC